MSSNHGSGRLYQPTYRDRKTGELTHSSIWWFEIPDGRGGKIRAATGIQGGSPGKPPREAREYLAQKRAELGRGLLHHQGLTWDHLSFALVTDRDAMGLKSLPLYKNRLTHIDAFFNGTRAEHIVDERDPARTVTAYVVHRRRQDAAIATINMELRLIRQAFRLAIAKGKLHRGPLIRMIPGENIRKGFVEDGEFFAILGRMRPTLAAAAMAMRLTGWREDEVLGLQVGSGVDFGSAVLRLEPGATKNGEGREFPFGEFEALRAVLLEQQLRVEQLGRTIDRIIPWLFPNLDGGRCTRQAFYAHWARARRAINSGKTPHDLRRTFARGGVMAGIDEGTLMALGGWKTRSVFHRYAIKDRAVLSAGTARLQASAPAAANDGQLVLFPTAAKR